MAAEVTELAGPKGKPDRDGGGEQALPHPCREQLQLVADLAGQPFDQLALLDPVQVDQPDAGRDRQTAADDAGSSAFFAVFFWDAVMLVVLRFVLGG